MSRPLQPADEQTRLNLAEVSRHLGQALRWAKNAKAPRLADKTERTLNSAQDAKHNARQRAAHAQSHHESMVRANGKQRTPAGRTPTPDLPTAGG